MKRTTILVLLILLPTAASIAQTAQDANAHAISSERLKSVMDGIHDTILRRMEEGGVEGAEVAGLADLAGAVEELLYHAELLTPETAPQKLSTSDIVTFRALASQLYTEALNVRDIAAAAPSTTYEFNQLEITYERLYQTCAACHALFRPPAGDPGTAQPP